MSAREVAHPYPPAQVALRRRNQSVLNKIPCVYRSRRLEIVDDLHRERPFRRIWHVITRGWSKMPQYANVLTPEERWQVVHYVRTLQKAMKKAGK